MMIPKKSLGQHFLNDLNIVKKIIQTAEVSPSDEILEIGPGKGILTRQLISSSRKVYAVEIDPRLVFFLKKELSSYRNLEIIEGDILKVSFDLLPPRFKIVANIPYQISSPLLTRLIQERVRISSMTLMVQKEVAERLVAKPGTKAYGTLSVFIQFYASAEPAFNITKHFFSPPPKVDSSVVKIVPLANCKIQTLNDPFFFKLVKASFAHRRKSIRNSLKDEGFSSDLIDVVFKNLTLDSSRRAETFTIGEFAGVSDQLFQSIPVSKTGV
ncbi:MAG: ribosomal RNA small subunit methyltransferase A [Nitrospirae bacterium]|nr:ribosomal RNA small subunit methyltransferase A [Nitrospirota bacterium]